MLLDQFTSTDWKLQKVQRGTGSANVVIGMKGTSVSGNINLEMTMIDGKWLIEDISIPLMSWTNRAEAASTASRSAIVVISVSSS